MTTEEWIARALAEAPPLTQAQKDRLRVILRPDVLTRKPRTPKAAA